ncbi:MAG: hypothetical protein O2U61_02635 [Candidatus Bathyarchaeota archaeon]|nr:hypothetical protein [Candidatus Bathyarchaeota archaeon]
MNDLKKKICNICGTKIPIIAEYCEICKEVKQKSNVYIQYFNRHKNEIPNIGRLIQKLEKDKKPGHIVHAYCIKKLFEDKNFQITDVELKKNGFDIDIEINNSINIQIWHGASASSYKILNGEISKLGGVEINWDDDKQNIFDKLNQLPNDNFGLLICFDYNLGINILPEWLTKIPKNKAIAELFYTDYGQGRTNECHLYHNTNFKYLEQAKQIVTSLGFPVKEMQFQS